MLGDCHVHVIMDGKNYKEAVALHKGGVKESVIHDCFSNYQKAGITFLRDGGDALGVSKRAKERACEYGITYLTPIFAIHKKGHYGGIVGRSFELITEYKKLVLEAKEAGADFIKIMATGGFFTPNDSPEDKQLSYDELKAIIETAHSLHKTVTAHAYTTEFVTTLAEAAAYYEANEARGECVIVMEGRSRAELIQEEQSQWESMTVTEHVAFYTDQGIDRKEAMKRAGKDRGVSKREIYAKLLEEEES